VYYRPVRWTDWLPTGYNCGLTPDANTWHSKGTSMASPQQEIGLLNPVLVAVIKKSLLNKLCLVENS